MTALKNATREHHQLIRAAKRNFFTDRLDKNSHNSRELFNIVKELSNPNANAITPSQDLCNSLATFFHRKITDLHDSFRHQTQPTTTEPTSPHELHPLRWKHAEVNALLKKPTADPSDLKNFRPISLLPFPAKVIEKTVNKQLTNFLEDNNLLDPSQSGFRVNHSTETALISVTDDIRTLMDNGETVALILLDLSAAFDTVCHRTLITHLRSTGIQGQALDWITSFLSNRSQRVYLPPFRSDPTEIICGVPQGSSLSPTLFNVYMSPLADIVRKHSIIITSYADDTQLILSLTKDPTSAKTNLQDGMKDVADWMKLSRLKLNSDKTEVLILGNTPTAWDDSWWQGTDPLRPCTQPRFHPGPTSHHDQTSQRHIILLLPHPPHAPKDLPLDPRRHQKDRDPRPRHEPPGLRQHPIRRNHSKTPETSATNSKRLRPPHPQHTSQQPHLHPLETPALASRQQKDHLPTPHPRTQSPPQQGTRIPQPPPQLLHSHKSSSLHQPRSRRRPSHPPLHGGWEVLLLPGGQDLELPPHHPQDHPGPLRIPETTQDLAFRAAVTPSP
ncbi:hypothetical protein NDU88_004984 [Pleurodeles waltl]|uniref:Reverse transcriptase domain-containing protein n=1 Tax=Pleurodeles waltl TaxID=8319 RepID=A0AAV7LMV9_PLEWA|nr:hypothetical protein NDU88_004984 [Pleurodeles waltl]